MEISTKNRISKILELKYLVFVVSILLFNFGAFSQAKEVSSRPSPTKVKKGFNSFDIENIVVGGNVGAQFGTITVINLNPTIGYKFTDNWLVGFGGTYLYYEDQRYTPTFSTNIYGGSIFSQYYFLEYFTAHIEYEILNVDAQFSTERVNVDALLVGGGYRSQIGANSFFNLMLLYNLIENVHYPYSNPIVRLGFGIGL